MTTTEKRIREYWDFLSSDTAQERRKKLDMSGLALMHEFHNYLVSGSRDLHYLDYFREKYLAGKSPKMASLGCGSGHLERTLVDRGFQYSQIHGFDISPNLVKFANDEARRLSIPNLAYFEMDMNAPQLPTGYDVAIFFHSLHHVERLEVALDEVATSLNEGGLLFVVDFVGPTRFQWTEKQLYYAQALLDLIPSALKEDLSRPPEGRALKTTIHRPSAEEVAGGDPSEAVRSGDIMALLSERFSVLEQRPMGGTLLSLVLHNIAGNFDETNELVRSLILCLQRLEETLVVERILSPDYVFLVLEPKARRLG